MKKHKIYVIERADGKMFYVNQEVIEEHSIFHVANVFIIKSMWIDGSSPSGILVIGEDVNGKETNYDLNQLLAYDTI